MLVGRSERAPVVGSHSRRRTSEVQQDEHGKADDVHEALTKVAAPHSREMNSSNSREHRPE